MYPMIGMATTLRLITKGKQHVSKGELMKWLGLRVVWLQNPDGGLSLCIGNILLKKELFLVLLIMALGLVCHAILSGYLPCLDF